jgi:PKHD-type hydroxylase
MSLYSLLPAADEQGKETLHSWWSDGFSIDEITEIIKVGETKIAAQAQVGQGAEAGVMDEIRRSKVSWISQNDLPWLYDRLGYIARRLNGQYFQLDLFGFHEDLQYTTYLSSETGHYDWHMDKGYSANGTPPRKLSMVLLLSHQDEYEGGELELLTGNGTTLCQKTQGIVHVFPSYVMHRVTPVTKGTRRSLVVWLTGPRFR